MDETGVDKTGVDETEVDKTVVDKTGVDKLRILPKRALSLSHTYALAVFHEAFWATI